MSIHNNLQKSILILAKTLLDDEEGISEDVYHQLLNCMEESGISHEIRIGISDRVETVEGRYYVGEGDLDEFLEL